MIGSLLAALFASFFATLGFGVLLHAPKRALLPASIAGMTANTCYFLLQEHRNRHPYSPPPF